LPFSNKSLLLFNPKNITFGQAFIMKKSTILKSLLTLFAIGLICSISAAQNNLNKWQLSDKSELTLNEKRVTGKTTYTEIESILGKANAKKEYSSGEISYIYDSIGMVISTMNGKIKMVGFNFNWDEDEKFPEKSFTGSLQIGNFTFSKKTTDNDVAKIEGVEFICPIPLMCASNNKKAKVKSMVAFKDSIITQVVILIE
jgi:hypothetical protein